MAEELEISPQIGEPRRCPVYGSRVAAMATTCLMCGALLIEGEIVSQEEERGQQRLPNGVRS